MKAVLVTNAGPADVLQFADIPRPEPGSGQILVRLRATGINFTDIYQRNGAGAVRPPFTAGVEGVGVVDSLGPDVTGIVTGQRVGWFSGGQGSYAEHAVVQADRAVPVPDDLPDDLAVASLLQGLTAQYLASDAYPVTAGETVLVHAAAGGVGQLLTQVAKIRGGRVIGTVSSDAKAAVARAAGADEVIGYDDFAEQVRERTGGEGVAAVYDGIGATTFDGSLASLRPRGTLVQYGEASGEPPLLDIKRLNTGGSLYLTRPTIVNYASRTDELRARSAEVFGWVASGALKIAIGGRYPLDRAADAQRDLESRTSTGKLVLIP